jgi:ABC-type transport system involved in cytochrome bd biosynthesis fused ATPase/permease subunit
MFNDSILHNIRYGRMDASMEEVRACCEQAQILTFIEGLPEQWETKVQWETLGLGLGLGGGGRKLGLTTTRTSNTRVPSWGGGAQSNRKRLPTPTQYSDETLSESYH